MSIFCPKCGEEQPAKDTFCGICGARLVGTIVGIPAAPDTGRKIPGASTPVTGPSTPGKAVNDTGRDTYFNNPDMLLGKMVGEYNITGIVGKGGMGWVYSGIHPIIEKKVAIKVLKTKYSEDSEIVNSFINEAKAANAIGSRKIIDIFAFGKLESGNCYFVMELLEGESLAMLLRQEQRVSWYDAYKILPDVLDALEAAHNSKIIHRDLKPENIHVARDSNGDFHIKLLDFGIAKFKEEGFSIHETTRGVIKGSPLYMSPEQCRGLDVTAQSDIYSFGVILYKLTTGREPFVSKSALEIITSHLREQPRPPMELAAMPKELNRLILDCLEKDVEKRPRNIAELRSRLVPILQEQALGTDKVDIPGSVSPVLLFIFALAIVAGVFFTIYKPFKKKPQVMKPTVVNYLPLNILSAHPQVVNREFERGFSTWLKKEYQRDVKIRWFSFRDELDSLPDKLKKAISEGGEMEFDVVFGGGESLHRFLASEQCATVKGQGYRCLQKYHPPVETHKRLTATLNGVNLYDPNGYWYGAALSGFGFFCDMEKLKKLGILAPVSWESLGSPQFFGHLTSADPTTSSSSYMTYDLILQNLKWDTGWETIFSLGANVRGDFLHSSKKVLGHVHEDPQVACGVVIDYLFFLQREEFKPAEQKRYRYFLPKETGLFTADPVAIVARAKNKEMAVRFIDYLLSEGQHLLIKRKGHPLGPVDRGLHRLPVLRTLYSKDPGNEFYVNPFDLVSGVTFDPKVSAEKKALFSLLLKKGIVDNHDNLVKCARRAIDKKLVEKALFRKVLPVTEKQFYVKVKELKTSNKLLWDRLQYVWNKHFHDAYNALYRK